MSRAAPSGEDRQGPPWAVRQAPTSSKDGKPQTENHQALAALQQEEKEKKIFEQDKSKKIINYCKGHKGKNRKIDQHKSVQKIYHRAMRFSILKSAYQYDKHIFPTYYRKEA